MFDAAQTAADTAGNALDLLFGPVQANTEPAEPAQCVSPWPRLRPVSTADPAQEARLAALVARFAASDQKALSELYDLTVSRIFTMARRVKRQARSLSAPASGLKAGSCSTFTLKNDCDFGRTAMPERLGTVPSPSSSGSLIV